MAQVKAPVADFTGTVAGVDFTDGIGDTDDERALAYFSRHGYDIVGADDFSADVQDDSPGTYPGGALGTPVPPTTGGTLDAADPENDLVPVGGVKSAAAPAAPVRKSSSARRRAEANTTDQPADTTPQQPVAANGDIQSAPSATTATTPSAAPAGDTSANDVTTATPSPDPTKGTTSSPDAPPAVEGTNLGPDTAPATSPSDDTKGA